MKTVYAITLQHPDGTRENLNVAIIGKVRDAMAAAEQAKPGSEAISGNPTCVIHLDVA